MLWFVLGIAFGAVAAVFARGDTMGTLHAARAWGAGALRSLEHRPAPASATPAAPSSRVPATAATHLPSRNAPCPVDPGPDDPCAELLAPFAANVPTVNVDDLPRVVPAAVVVARRHARAAAPAGTEAPAAVEVSTETEPAPAGVNPDPDDPDRPTRVVPRSAPAADRPSPGAPTVEETSAKNEAT